MTLISEETELPYRRPPLSKQLLRSEDGPAALAFRPLESFARHGIRQPNGRCVAGTDCAERRISLADGETRAYSMPVLATGAQMGAAGAWRGKP